VLVSRFSMGGGDPGCSSEKRTVNGWGRWDRLFGRLGFVRGNLLPESFPEFFSRLGDELGQFDHSWLSSRGADDFWQSESQSRIQITRRSIPIHPARRTIEEVTIERWGCV